MCSKLRYDTTMVFNGDVLSGADLGALLTSHADREADVTLHLVRVGDPRAFGCVPTDSDGVVTAFLEKTQDPPTDQINAGCYVFQREVHRPDPEGPRGLGRARGLPELLSDGLKVCGYVDSTYWRDMGTPEDFVRGSADLVRGIAPSPALGGHRGEELVHDGAAVAPGALLIGGTVVGRGAEIGPGVRLDGAVIFDGARIEAGTVIERSIIGFGARIGPRALIRDGGHRRRRPHRRALRAAARRAGVARGGHSRRRHPLLDRRLSRAFIIGGSPPLSHWRVAAVANCVSPKSPSGIPSSGHHRRSSDSSLQTSSAPGGAWAMNCMSRWRVGTPSEQVTACTCSAAKPESMRQSVDSGLLLCLAECGRDDVGVGHFAVATQLNPPAQPRMQRQHGLSAGVVEHQGRSGDVPGDAGPLTRVGPGQHECEHGLAKRVVCGVGRLPGRQNLDHRLMEAHRRCPLIIRSLSLRDRLRLKLHQRGDSTTDVILCTVDYARAGGRK